MAAQDPRLQGTDERPGRLEPAHLRFYESFDDELLPLAANLGQFTFDQLVAHVASPRARAMAPRWLASASWRRLIQRHDPSRLAPRTYTITQQGRHQLRAAQRG